VTRTLPKEAGVLPVTGLLASVGVVRNGDGGVGGGGGTASGASSSLGGGTPTLSDVLDFFFVVDPASAPLFRFSVAVDGGPVASRFSC
jgi:hypothetical protein